MQLNKILDCTKNLEKVGRAFNLKEKERLGQISNNDKEQKNTFVKRSISLNKDLLMPVKSSFLQIPKTEHLLKDKFVNQIMQDGKRFKALQLLSLSLCRIKQKQINSKPIVKNGIQTILTEAVKNVKPAVEVRKIKKSGKIYFVPLIPFEKRKQALAIRWIIEAARNRQKTRNLSFADSLAEEILDAFQEKGKAREKRDKLHAIAQNNRGNLRFRWW